MTLTTLLRLPALKIIYFLQSLIPRSILLPPRPCAGGDCSILPPGLDGLLSRCLSNSICTKIPCISPNSMWVLRSAGLSL